MKISKIFFNLFLAGFLLFGFLYVYNSVQYGKKKAVWEAEKVRLNESITDHQAEAKFHAEEAEKWQESANAEATKRREVEKNLEKERLDHARDLAKIPDLAPDEVVSELHRRLQVAEKEIVLTEEGVVFSEAATRLVLSRVQSYDFHLAIEFPERDKLLASQGSEIRDLKGVIFNKDGTITSLELERDDWKAKFEGEETLRKASESSFNLFSTKNLVVGGVIVAVLVGLSFVLK